MINIIKFAYGCDYKSAWNFTARASFIIYEHLENCLVLYRYKLADGFDVPFIWQKFGTSDPDKIDFNKINADSILLFHLEVYKEKPNEIRKLIEFCIERNIDLYIIASSYKTIHQIIHEYDVTEYVFNNLGLNEKEQITNVLSPVLRDIKLKRLLD